MMAPRESPVVSRGILLWPDYEELQSLETRESDENIPAQLGLGRRFTAMWNSLHIYFIFTSRGLDY